MKVCKQCGIEKSIHEYYGKPTNRDFLDTVCIQCRIDEKRERYARNPEKFKARQRGYYQRQKLRMFHMLLDTKTHKQDNRIK